MTDKARVSIDLPPEVRRQLKTIAAQLDRPVRDLVLANLEQNLEGLRRAVPDAAMVAQIEETSAHLSAMLTPDLRAAVRQASADAEQALAELRQAAPDLAREVATIGDDAVRALGAVESSAFEAAEERARTRTAALLPALAPEQGERVRAVMEQALAEQGAAFREALDRSRQEFGLVLAESQRKQAEAFRRQLDPFARDWETDADSIYDEEE